MERTVTDDFLTITKTLIEKPNFESRSSGYKDWIVEKHSQGFILLAIHPGDFIHIFGKMKIRIKKLYGNI